MFKVGDKVLWIEDSAVGRAFNISKNKVYTVIKVDKSLIVVDGVYGSFYAHRFVHVNPDYATITPVIRKIREMEERRGVSYAAI